MRVVEIQAPRFNEFGDLINRPQVEIRNDADSESMFLDFGLITEYTKWTPTHTNLFEDIVDVLKKESR